MCIHIYIYIYIHIQPQSFLHRCQRYIHPRTWCQPVGSQLILYWWRWRWWSKWIRGLEQRGVTFNRFYRRCRFMGLPLFGDGNMMAVVMMMMIIVILIIMIIMNIMIMYHKWERSWGCWAGNLLTMMKFLQVYKSWWYCIMCWLLWWWWGKLWRKQIIENGLKVEWGSCSLSYSAFQHSCFALLWLTQPTFSVIIIYVNFFNL